MKVMFAAIGSEMVSIEVLSSVLKKHRHQCALAFERGMFDDKQYFSIPFLARIFNDRAQVIKDIVEYRPELLAFSVFSDNFQWCLDVARQVKKRMNVPVIMGGVHPSSVPEVCIAEDSVDIVCLGEGEYALLDLVESMKNGKIDYTIKNLWFKKDGQIIKNPPRPLIQDLDNLPMLDKELFEKFIPISSYYLTVTNRGCLARCSYCAQNFYARWEQENGLGPFYRERSVHSVIEELKLMKKRYRYKRVDIKNNVLSASKKWTVEFLKRYKEEIAVPFRIMGHPKTIDEDVAQALKDAGCWHVQIGIESLNPRIRKDVLMRYESNEDIYQALKAMDKANLNYSVDIMVGLPHEKDADIIQAIELFSEKKNLIRASIFWLKYFPQVDITRYAFNNKLLTEEDMAKINKGLQANYLSTGSVGDRKKRERLFNFQILLRILPIAPKRVIKFILHRGYYRYFKYLPQVPVIITADILVSIFRKDYWAIYAIFSYFWELKRRIKRLFKVRKTFGCGIKMESSPWVLTTHRDLRQAWEEPIKTTDIQTKILSEKPLLLNWYRTIYKYMTEHLLQNSINVEIGSGSSRLYEHIPGLIRSNIIFIRENDLVFSAYQMPFRQNSIGNIILISVLHHLNDPYAFFSEAKRVLKPRGRILISDPYLSRFSYFIWKYLHYENCDLSHLGFEQKGSLNPLFAANSANATILFYAQKNDFKRMFPHLTITELKPHSKFHYWLAGGYNFPQLLPTALSPLVNFMERFFTPLDKWLASFMFVVIEKEE